MSASPLLVVGLGNPGSKYATTRHNAGFLVVDHLASKFPTQEFRKKFSGEFAKCTIGGTVCVLLRPETFMNESGRSVQAAAAFLKTESQRIVVVHDELDLPFGEVRIKLSGGHAGHNGLRSIIGLFGSPDFVRVRIGIGRPPAGFTGDVADFVLSAFSAEERAQVPALIEKGSDAVQKIVLHGPGRAMNELNTRAKPVKTVPRSGTSAPRNERIAETSRAADSEGNSAEER